LTASVYSGSRVNSHNKNKAFRLYILAYAGRRCAPSPACASQCLPKALQAARTSAGRHPRSSSRPGKRRVFQDFIVEAKALTVPIQSLSRSPLRPRKAKTAPPAGFCAAHPGQRRQTGSMPLRISVTPQAHVNATPVPGTNQSPLPPRGSAASAPTAAMLLSKCRLRPLRGAVRLPSGPP